jgi:hypothetical protein
VYGHEAVAGSVLGRREAISPEELIGNLSRNGCHCEQLRQRKEKEAEPTP